MFRKAYTDWAVGGKWDVKDLIGRSKEQAAIQTGTRMWLIKRGEGKIFRDDMVRRRGDERSFSDHTLSKRGAEKSRI